MSKLSLSESELKLALEASERAEEKIAHLASFPELNPHPVAEFSEDGNVIYANKATKVLFPDLETSGSRHPYLNEWQNITSQLRNGTASHIAREVKVGEKSYLQTIQYIKPQDTFRIYSRDITERKQAEERANRLNQVLRAVRNVNQLITREGDRQTLISKACQNLVKTRGFDKCWIAVMDTFGKAAATAEANWGSTFAPVAEQLRKGIMPPCVDKVMKLGKAAVITEAEHGSVCGDCLLQAGHGVYGSIVAPMSYAGRAMGILAVTVPQAIALEAEEIALFQEMADDIAFALNNFELENKHKKAEEAIKSAAEEWRTTFDSIKDLVALVDANHTILRVNQAFADALEVKPQSLIGKHCYEVMHGMNQPHPMCPHARTLESGHYESSEYFDGKLKIWVEATSSPIFDDKGQLTGAVHIIKNITGRKQTEAENRRFQDKAEMSSRLAVVGEMAAGIAHEINNPLTGVLGFSELLAERQDLPEDVKEELKIIADGSNRVKDIVRRMLTFARQVKPVRTSVSINELIDATLDLRTYVLRTANLEVVKHLDPELPWLVIDPGQMQQVFLNIIVNAEYAMKKAHGKGTLTITAEKMDDHIHISFKDDGTGMSQETVKKLFQPFFTTKEVNEGTGLGLSLSRSIILEHGGTIEVESELGKGANFIITLPVTPGDEAVAQQAIADSNTSPENYRHASILVVDDEESIRKLIQTIMVKNGHTVETTDSPEEGLKKLDERRFDIVLLDIRMPGMSGMELYAKIIEKHPELSGKFIFITGDTSDTNTRTFLEQNKLPYISKPFERETLLQKVNGLL